jgi:hypothetical protein
MVNLFCHDPEIDMRGQIPHEKAFKNPGIKSFYLATPPITRYLCVHTGNPSLEMRQPLPGIYCIDRIAFALQWQVYCMLLELQRAERAGIDIEFAQPATRISQEPAPEHKLMLTPQNFTRSSGSAGGRVNTLFRVNCPTHSRGFLSHVSTVGFHPYLAGEEKMCEEKRKFKRFKGKEGAFAAFIRPNELMNVGQIQDISMGGLCVRYLSTNEDKKGCSEIKIFGSNDRFIHLGSVQCRIVYDREVPEGSWEQISTRRCGVEFENLSAKHLSMLQDFIDYFAFDETQSANPKA